MKDRVAAYWSWWRLRAGRLKRLVRETKEEIAASIGVGIASVLFAVALLASGQNSTLTGTLAGQIVMEGFLNFRITPWLRRLITRALAIIPAVFIIGIFGEGKTTDLLVASQVALSMQLGFAVWPLMRFTSEKAKMGEFANRLWLKILGLDHGSFGALH